MNAEVYVCLTVDRHPCEKCPVDFATYEELRHHDENIHPSFSCEKCNEQAGAELGQAQISLDLIKLDFKLLAVMTFNPVDLINPIKRVTDKNSM